MHTDFISKLEANYERVFQYTGGHPDSRIVTLVAAQYTFADKEYSGVKQQQVIDLLQADKTISSGYIFGGSPTILSKLACYLILKGEPIEEQLARLRKKERLLAGCGFKKSPYRLASALFVEDTAHGVRAKSLYDTMRKKQPILTRKSDFPFVVFLTAKEGAPVSTRVRTMYEYFMNLRRYGFKMGDSLQMLAQVLTLFDIQYHDNLVQYVVKMKEMLEQSHIKVKKMHYPYLGILALAATNRANMEDIIQLEAQLRQTKALKGAKHLALMLAIQKLVRQYVDTEDLVTTAQFTHWSDLFSFSDFFLSFDSVIPEGIEGFLELQY